MKVLSLLVLLPLPGAVLVYRSGLCPAEASSSPEPATAAWAQGLGHVEPESEVRRLSFKNNGVITRCAVRPGKVYRRGEVLAVLRNDEERAAVRVAEKDLALARAGQARVLAGLNRFQVEAARHRVDELRERLERARREADRSRRLRPSRSISDEEHTRIRAQLRQTQASLREAEALLDQARNHVTAEDRAVAEGKVDLAAARQELTRRQYEETLLRAPCDGQVLEVLKREGDAVRLVDVEPVLLFADLSRLWVRAEIEDRFVSRLRQGQQAVLSGRGLGGEVRGRVVRIKRLMGPKKVFSGAATERRDLDVIGVFIEPEGPFAVPVGLRVDVKVMLDG
jgi:multidrug resistance efflux pump